MGSTLICLLFLGIWVQETTPALHWERTTNMRRPAPEVRPPQLDPAFKPSRKTADGKPERGGSVRHITGIAAKAAEETARRLASREGYAEYYRLGFWFGQQSAFKDPSTVDWDFRQGLSVGKSGIGVRELGYEYGLKLADEAALALAEKEVAQRFYDLSEEPSAEPIIANHMVPTFEAAPPTFPKAELEEVFAFFPLYHGAVAPMHSFAKPDDFQLDPLYLHGVRDPDSFFSRTWREPDTAFTFWQQDRANRRYFSDLAQDEKSRFREYFKQTYSEIIDSFYDEFLQPAYEFGYQDGFRYGYRVFSEWRFRQGYKAGAEEAALRIARQTYRQEFAPVYVRRFAEVYQRWQTTPVLQIDDLRWQDADENGVLMPGEAFSLTLVVTNFGGAPGNRSVHIAGDTLTEEIDTGATFPPRSQITMDGFVQAALRADILNKTPVIVHLRVGDQYRRLQWEALYPLQLLEDSGFEDIDYLGGTVVAKLHCRNISTKTVEGCSLQLGSLSKRVGTLAPGEEGIETITVDGLDPLLLIGGRLGLPMTVSAAGGPHDRQELMVPEIATNPARGELLEMMLFLAGQAEPDPGKIALAHDLMLARLREDWKRAVTADGNPYRKDHKENATTTALGELVATYRQFAGEMRRPDVFKELVPLLETESKNLPGWHPILRRHFKKLVSEIK